MPNPFLSRFKTVKSCWFVFNVNTAKSTLTFNDIITSEFHDKHQDSKRIEKKSVVIYTINIQYMPHLTHNLHGF